MNIKNANHPLSAVIVFFPQGLRPEACLADVNTALEPLQYKQLSGYWKDVPSVSCNALPPISSSSPEIKP